jgi:hypothetical protein
MFAAVSAIELGAEQEKALGSERVPAVGYPNYQKEVEAWLELGYHSLLLRYPNQR